MTRLLLVLFIGGICAVTVLGHEDNSNCQVFYKPSLIGITSESANVNMGVILDYSSRVIVVLNENRSSIDIVDISEQVTYYLKNEETFNFEDYFQKLPSLQALLKTGQDEGEKSDLDDLDESVLAPLEEAFKSIDGSSPLPEISLLTKFIEELQGPLSLVYMGSGSFRIANGVDGFMKVNQVVAELLNYSEEKLSPKNVKFNATEVFKTESEAEVLLKVLSQAGKHLDLIKVFSGLFASPDKVQSLLVNASGGSHDGLDGLLTILVNYVGVYNGKSRVRELIRSVLAYNSRPAVSLSSFINQTLTEVEDQDERFNNARGFSIYVSILNAMVTHNYTSNNLSLSDIITRLTTRVRNSRNPLITLVELLSSFYPSSTIPHFFGSIIKQFNQTMFIGSTPENSNAQVFYKQYLIAIVNQSAKMAVISDPSLIVVLNGNRPFTIVVDVSKQVKYTLKNEPDIQKRIWSNFSDFFKKLSSPEAFFENGQVRSKESKLSVFRDSASGAMQEVFDSLGGSLPIWEEISLFKNVIHQLRGVILGFVYRKSGSFRIASGVDAFVKVNLEMAQLSVEVSEFRNSPATSTTKSSPQL